jgi:tetratricopeptide (TPR) repeat protein
MPHLSELSEKYKDNATFIGANVWEKTGDKPYESVLPRLNNFLKSSSKKMTYNVVADNNAQELSNLWLKPAGILGIPTTFIVSKGKLAWIGHPEKIDSIIKLMLAGTYDVAAFKKEYEKKQSSPSNMQTNYRIVADKIKAAVAAKEFEKAFLIIEEGVKQMPVFQASLQYEKLLILLKHFPENEALDFAKKLINENKNFGPVIGNALADKDSLSVNTYLFVAEIIQNGLNQQAFSANFDKLALAYSKAGNFQAAVDAEEKAVAAATQEVKDGKYEGYVFDFTIKEYEETLKQYKKALKKQK